MSTQSATRTVHARSSRRVIRSAAALTTTLVAALSAVAINVPATAQPDIPCEQWQQMHPGWPCVPVPKPPPGPPPGQPTTPPALPTPALPGQPPGDTGGVGGQAGALVPPAVGPGNGRAIVPVPGQEPPQPPLDTPSPPKRNQPAPDDDRTPVTSDRPNDPRIPPIQQSQSPAIPATQAPSAPNPTSTSAATVAVQPTAGMSPLTWLLLPLLLAVGAGGFVLGRRFVRDGPTTPSAIDGLPGLPPPVTPVPPGTPVLTSRFSITRLYPGVYAPPGWMSRDFNDNPGIPGVYRSGQGPFSGYGSTIPIDPKTTPGAIGPWSGNVLTPDPITGKTGISIPTGGKGPNAANNSLDIDVTKKVQLQIVGLKPVVVSSFDLNGNSTLAVTYEPMYQVRTLIYGMGTMIVTEPGEWTDISLEDVKTLERMGAFVPVIPSTN